MNLAEFFDPDLVDIDLKAKSKLEAVERLSDLFCRKYPDKNRQAILCAVAEREELGSTSIGRGFAFPHARTDAVDDLYIAFGFVRDGVIDKTPDGIPIKAICLLLTPRNISKLYLQALSGLANFARRPGMLECLSAAGSSREFVGFINDIGIEVKRVLTVRDIMSAEVVTVSPEDSLKTVANVMFKYNFNSIPVVDRDGRLIGDVSGRELLKSAFPDKDLPAVIQPDWEPFEDLLRREDNFRVGDIVRRDPATISEAATVVEAAAMMLARNIERIMVVHGEKLVGIISTSDIISKIIRG